MSEQRLTKAIIEAVNASRLAYVWRSQAGTLPIRGRFVHLAPNGCPDIVGYMMRGARRGRFVGIEVKLPGKKPSDAQQAWRAELRACDCVHAIAYSVDDAIAVLREATS
jgi:hypothetical protein